MATKLITAMTPIYAPDGSYGYHLIVDRTHGWIRVGNDDRTVYATLDRAPWRTVDSVASRAELTPAWITDHTSAILAAFGR